MADHPKRPNPPHDSTATKVATRREPFAGDVPVRSFLDRVDFGFVAVSWLLSLLATIVLFAIGTAIVAAVSQTPIAGETNTELGVLMIVSAFSTFLGFVIVMVNRITHIGHDRAINSISVGVLHVLVAIVVFLVGVILETATGTNPGSLMTGTWTDELGTYFTVLERSAAASILACLLAIGMAPEHGGRPSGTQTDVLDDDHTM